MFVHFVLKCEKEFKPLFNMLKPSAFSNTYNTYQIPNCWIFHNIIKYLMVFNLHFRKEKRRAYFDMQTFSIHYPQNGKGKMKVIEKPTLGHYPVALIPGQFTDHYRTYSSNQLKYMPLNTAIKSAPKKPKAFHMAVATAVKRKKLAHIRANKRPRSDGGSSDSSRYAFK